MKPLQTAILLAALSAQVHAASVSLTANADPTSTFSDYFSNAFARINLNPDGFYDITNPSTQYGAYDVFPNETVFNVGTLTYDASLLTGVGSETISIQNWAFDGSSNVDIAETYTTTLSSITGTVSFLNGSFASANLAANVGFGITSGALTGLTYDGTLSITGNNFALGVDDTESAFGFDFRNAWNVFGTGVAAVPEPSAPALLVAAAGLFAMRRRRR